MVAFPGSHDYHDSFGTWAALVSNDFKTFYFTQIHKEYFYDIQNRTVCRLDLHQAEDDGLTEAVYNVTDPFGLCP